MEGSWQGNECWHHRFWVGSCGGPGSEVGLACLILHAIQAALTSNVQKLNQGEDGKNRRLVADEPVVFEKWPVEVGDWRKFTDRFRGI